MNTLVGATFDKVFFYVSPSHPAGTYNDQLLWNTYGADFRSKLTADDVTIADGAFSKDWEATKTLSKYKPINNST